MRLLLLVCIMALQATSLSAQTKTRKINLKHADKLVGKQSLNFQRLLGHVEFEHEGATMYCDSAHLFDNNSIDAYGNVHIKQGDSLNLWGDVLNYKGNERRADMSGEIIMTDGDMTLTTDHLVYDMKSKVANYSTGGTIVNQQNTLTSQIGSYNSEAKMFSFSRNVKLVNPQYTMNCDTLHYQPVTKVAYFYGPTEIIASNKKNYIYCENGFYDTNRDVSAFNRKAYLITNGQKLRGDSLWYDRKNGVGKAIKNISITDTAKHVLIRGDYAFYNEINDRSTVTGHALFIQAEPKAPKAAKDSLGPKNDSLVPRNDSLTVRNDSLKITNDSLVANDSLYLHADTLLSYAISDSNTIKHKTTKDSVAENRIIFAYHHAKFYRNDMQGKCDSLVYTTADSTMRLFKQPVLWSDENQLSAESIEILTANGEIHQMKLQGSAFLASQDDSIRFNQVKGRKMTGYFNKGNLDHVLVEGSGQTLYCAREQNVLIGINKTICANLVIYVKDNKVKSIKFYDKPEAQLIPPDMLPPKESRLKGFKWRASERPNQVNDIFTW